jgi:hypothetical protein
MAYSNPRYNGRVGVYRTDEIERFGVGPLGWTGSVLHFDSSLPTSPSDAYGYNTLSGGLITRLSNLSDVTMITDATGSGTLAGTGSSTNIYINIPSTPLFTIGKGFTSSVTYNISSTQSTYFMVATSYFSEINNFNSIIRSNGNTESAQSISDGVGGLVYQANKAIDDIVGAHTFTKSLGVNYLTTLRGTTTETSNGTVVKSNGSTHSFSSGFTLGTNYTQTSLFEYYITSSPDTRGRTMSFNELIYFDYRLSDIDFNAVESYLKTKWSISY